MTTHRTATLPTPRSPTTLSHALFVYNGAIIGIAVLLAVAWSRAAHRE